mmetsp:Transcript_15762/g.23059  ORF Transcript_15762/g.23059 Transcript_15762/m.23059 type:complete len:83 (-) Transcript_15762:227-475(-)
MSAIHGAESAPDDHSNVSLGCTDGAAVANVVTGGSWVDIAGVCTAQHYSVVGVSAARNYFVVGVCTALYYSVVEPQQNAHQE